jgi:hypothetical protein
MLGFCVVTSWVSRHTAGKLLQETARALSVEDEQTLTGYWHLREHESATHHD